jgi:septal ring factor EnvC (AmiA/AmiB activator)
MLYAGKAMGELHTGNGPLADGDPADRDEVVGEELSERLEDLQRRFGRCEGRLELSQVSETILREQLKRERERADRLEAELREAEAELRVAEVALHKFQRGWISRFFGIGAAKH